VFHENHEKNLYILWLGSARLEGEGGAGDITMSREFVEDPAVAEMLRKKLR
jgi:hypothetical protein